VTTTDWEPSQLQRERDAYRRGRTRRSAAIAAISLIVVGTVVVVVVGHSSGWDRVRDSFFDFKAGWDGLPGLLHALWVNVQIMLVTEAIVLVLAALIAIARTLQGPVWFPLRLLATVYVDLFRGMPLLIVLFLVGYGIPALRFAAGPKSPFTLCIISLVLCYTAYVAEVFRAGIESIHPSQRAAARSLGLTYGQALRHVVFPQAVRRVLPPLLNDFVSLQKDTALVSFLGVMDMTLVATNESSKDFKFVYYVVAGLIFVALTIPFTRLTDWVGRRQGWMGSGGGVV
jgi:polar amino acid transport system permease protein